MTVWSGTWMKNTTGVMLSLNNRQDTICVHELGLPFIVKLIKARMHHLQAVYKLIMHISIPLTFFRAKDAVWPPRTSLTGILLRWMDLTAMGVKVPSGSGPNSRVSLSRINPRNVVPDTTVPTPCQENTQTVLIYEHSIHFVCSV